KCLTRCILNIFNHSLSPFYNRSNLYGTRQGIPNARGKQFFHEQLDRLGRLQNQSLRITGLVTS
ncbi:MAG TPA: hypothetical protein VNV85_14225, partial [Puia sp.]|nr:hypothetical protein [Puia sp.]